MTKDFDPGLELCLQIIVDGGRSFEFPANSKDLVLNVKNAIAIKLGIGDIESWIEFNGEKRIFGSLEENGIRNASTLIFKFDRPLLNVKVTYRGRSTFTFVNEIWLCAYLKDLVASEHGLDCQRFQLTHGGVRLDHNYSTFNAKNIKNGSEFFVIDIE